MTAEKTTSAALVLLAVGGLAWSVTSFVRGSEPPVQEAIDPVRASQMFGAEQPDKCATPEGYTDAEWQEHMGHHPDQYRKCLPGASPTVAPTSAPAARATTAPQPIVTPDELTTLLAHSDVVVMDVRPGDPEQIPGTDLVIPYEQLAVRRADLPEDPKMPIVVYGRSDAASIQAATVVRSLGYVEVAILLGGIKGWTDAGYALEEPTP